MTPAGAVPRAARNRISLICKNGTSKQGKIYSLAPCCSCVGGVSSNALQGVRMPAPNPEKLNALMGRLVGDLGAIATGALVLLGDKLGIYKAMGDGKAVTAEDLAEKT